MKTAAICLTIALLGHPSLAQAQFPPVAYGPSTTTGYGVPRHHYGFGGPVAGHVHHSSTVYEGVYRGRAAVIQAQAQYNLMTSAALMNLAEAQRMHWENQQMYRQARIAEFEEVRQKKASRRAARREAFREQMAAKQQAEQERRVQLASSW